MGDYPGSEYKMSSYGLKVYNPQETVGQWAQCCKVHYTLRMQQGANYSSCDLFCRWFH